MVNIRNKKYVLKMYALGLRPNHSQCSKHIGNKVGEERLQIDCFIAHHVSPILLDSLINPLSDHL